MKKKKKKHILHKLFQKTERGNTLQFIYLINTTFIPKPDKEVVTKKHSGQSKSWTQKAKIMDKVLHSESYKQGSYLTLSEKGPGDNLKGLPAGQRWNNLIIIQNGNCNWLKHSSRVGKRRGTNKILVSHEAHTYN